MLLLFPVAFIFYIKNRIATDKKINWLVVIYGAVLGALVSGFRAFFMFRSSYNGSNIFYYVIDSWLCYGFVLILFCAISYFFSKDDVKVKFSSYISFVLPFMAVYFVAETMSLKKPFPFFVLFVKPVLYLCMVLGVRKSIESLYNKVKKNSQFWKMDAILIAIETTIPAIIEAVWYYQISKLILFVICAVYVAISILRTITLKELITIGE